MCGVHGLAGEPHCPRCWESRLYTNCCKGRERDEGEARVIGGRCVDFDFRLSNWKRTELVYRARSD